MANKAELEHMGASEMSDIKTENIWLMKGDCLERMKEIPSGSVEMILTDPPYGMNLKPQRVSGKFHGVSIKNDDSLDWSDEFFWSVTGLQKKTQHQCFFVHTTAFQSL